MFLKNRFNDICIPIRIKCVQYSMHFLLNHPELRSDIVETLKVSEDFLCFSLKLYKLKS